MPKGWVFGCECPRHENATSWLWAAAWTISIFASDIWQLEGNRCSCLPALWNYCWTLRKSSIKLIRFFFNFSIPLHPTPALDSLPIQLALYSRRDPQLSTAPHSIHLTGEMSSKLGWVNQQQGFVVGVGCCGWPVEAACDHFFVNVMVWIYSIRSPLSWKILRAGLSSLS